MNRLLVWCCVAIVAGAGCKEEAPLGSGGGTPVPEPQLARGHMFRLELDTLKVDKVVGSGGSAQTLKNVLGDHGLLIWTPEREASLVVVGLTGAPGSYATSRYTRVKRQNDPVAVRLEPFAVGMQLRDGRRLELEISSSRLTLPGGGSPPDGELDKDVQLEARGGFSLALGDTRISGSITGTWMGGRDSSPPEVQVVAPAAGIVTGKVEVFFDEPVKTERLPERLFIRDAARNPLEMNIEVEKTDLPDATTHVTLKPRALLPFDAKLSVAVGSELTDLIGRRLDKPTITVFNTSTAPPLLVGHETDFGFARGDDAIQRIGDVEYLTQFGLERALGRYVRLKPPLAVGGTTSAIVTRLMPPGNASELRIRVRKLTRLREQSTPCLTVVLAQPSGIPWTVDCGPTEAPREEILGPDATWFATPWTDLIIPLSGQRGTEVVLAIDAAPLAPSMNPAMDAQFLIERIHVVGGL